MDDNNFDNEILEVLKPIRIKYSIKRPPSYKLRECLSYYTKQQLVDIAYEHGQHISMSKNKDIIIEILEEILIENISNDSLYMTTLEREIIARLIKNNGIAGNDLEKTITVKSLGYIYWFYHGNEFYVVCPTEIANRYMIAYEEDNEGIISRNNKILNYIKALQNIYGVFEADQLAVVWNKHNKDKLDEQDIYEFMNIVGRRQNYVWWDSAYIISDYFEDEEEYEEYLISTAGRSYYIPTKEELKYYMENEFDEENIYYKRVLRYFEINGDLDEIKLDDLMLSIEISCTLDNSFQDIVNEIDESGFSFKSLDDVKIFAGLYMDLSNNTRKWNLKGYKPVELRNVASKPLNNNVKNNVIPFQRPIVSKTKKVGRNELCPCGSGKKYKFCCGK